MDAILHVTTFCLSDFFNALRFYGHCTTKEAYQHKAKVVGSQHVSSPHTIFWVALHNDTEHIFSLHCYTFLR